MNRFHELDDVGLLSEEADGGELREETPARVAQVRRGYVIAFLMLLVFNSTALVSLVTPAPSSARLQVVDAIRRPSPDPLLEDHAI